MNIGGLFFGQEVADAEVGIPFQILIVPEHYIRLFLAVSVFSAIISVHLSSMIYSPLI